MNLAAESHVDRSIDGPAEFIRTNVVGTFTLLQEALRYWRGLEPARRNGFRLLHVSTDEVYGSLGPAGFFTETTAYEPNSPYSASKASSDHLVRAWRETYELPTLVTNCSNNYGPYHFPEKLIPHMIIKGLADRNCRSTATASTSATGSMWKTMRGRSRWCWSAAASARPTTSAGATSAPTCMW